MLEMLKERKAALQAEGKKGFTLMEMLIVIAIIAILIAIAIPLFTAQLDNAKQATDLANARSIYAMVTADYMDDLTIDNAPSPTTLNGKGTVTIDGQKFEFSDKTTALTINTSGTPYVRITTNGHSETFGSASS